VQGGPGTDTVTYDYFFSQGTDDLQISLDNVANDGPITDPRGNIHSDVENLTTGNGDDTLDGGAGEDRINGNNSNNGNDTVRGGADDDVLDGSDALGHDDPAGGAGLDFVAILRDGDVSVTLDGVADDGPPGEMDNIQASVEDITTGDGHDYLAGTNAANELNDGAGNDRIFGMGGRTASKVVSAATPSTAAATATRCPAAATRTCWSAKTAPRTSCSAAARSTPSTATPATRWPSTARGSADPAHQQIARPVGAVADVQDGVCGRFASPASDSSAKPPRRAPVGEQTNCCRVSLRQQLTARPGWGGRQALPRRRGPRSAAGPARHDRDSTPAPSPWRP